MGTYKCSVCGKVFEVGDGAEPVCPICKAKGDKLRLSGEKNANPYAGTKTEKNLEAAFAACGLDASRRGESFSLNEFAILADALL